MTDALLDIDTALVATIAWNSRGWQGPSDDASDWEDATFKSVQKAKTAHEWWNFYVDHPKNDESYVYGYFNVSGDGAPDVERDESLAVVFASKDHRTGETYVVGLYLGANYSEDGWPGVEPKRDGSKKSRSRLRCPRDGVWVAEPKRLLQLDKGRHLKGKSIGRRGFTYVDEVHVRRIMKDLADAQIARATELMAGLHFG